MLQNAGYPWEKIWLETREGNGGSLLSTDNILFLDQSAVYMGASTL